MCWIKVHVDIDYSSRRRLADHGPSDMRRARSIYISWRDWIRMAVVYIHWFIHSCSQNRVCVRVPIRFCKCYRLGEILCFSCMQPSSRLPNTQKCKIQEKNNICTVGIQRVKKKGNAKPNQRVSARYHRYLSSHHEPLSFCRTSHSITLS